MIKMSMNVLGEMGLVSMGHVSTPMAHIYAIASLAIQVGLARKILKNTLKLTDKTRALLPAVLSGGHTAVRGYGCPPPNVG